MNTLYLLMINDQDVLWSVQKSELEAVVANAKSKNEYVACETIFKLELEDFEFKQLQTPCPLLAKVPSLAKEPVPQWYIEKEKKVLDNPPKWFLNEGLRVYVIFDKKGDCRWSPSGNNLESIANKFPEAFVTSALYVSLDNDSYRALYSYFEWTCDNF